MAKKLTTKQQIKYIVHKRKLNKQQVIAVAVKALYEIQRHIEKKNAVLVIDGVITPLKIGA
jgi:hypothetical protein